MTYMTTTLALTYLDMTDFLFIISSSPAGSLSLLPNLSRNWGQIEAKKMGF